MFIAALFTITKIWKEPKCLSVDEWIKQLWGIYTMEYYSAIKVYVYKSSHLLQTETILLRQLKFEVGPRWQVRCTMNSLLPKSTPNIHLHSQ